MRPEDLQSEVERASNDKEKNMRVRRYLSNQLSLHLDGDDLQKGVTDAEKYGIQEEKFIEELRIRFLRTLKSLYDSSFRHGQCLPQSLILLSHSISMAIDKENCELNDFSYIQDYMVS